MNENFKKRLCVQQIGPQWCKTPISSPLTCEEISTNTGKTFDEPCMTVTSSRIQSQSGQCDLEYAYSLASGHAS